MVAALLSGAAILFTACPNPATQSPGGPRGPGVGTITTVAGNGGIAVSTSLGKPLGVALDNSGTLYIAAGNMIRTVDANGRIRILAGTGVQGYSGDKGPSIYAELNSPTALAIDGSGNLFVADTGNNCVREITPHQEITTVAGTGTAGNSGDNGAATSAELDHPRGVTVDGAGDLFIADTGNNVVRKVSGGTISRYAGKGTAGFSGDSGSATSAELSSPWGVAVDGSGNLYVADLVNHRIRMVIPPGAAGSATITTYAGNGTAGYSGDGGAPLSAELSSPAAVVLDGAGNLYISDTDNATVRMVTPPVGKSKGSISTFAGTGVGGFSVDGSAVGSAQLGQPVGIAMSSSGDVFIAEAQNGRVRRITNGIIETAAGDGISVFPGDSQQALYGEILLPAAVALDGKGNFYISDALGNRIREVGASGIITTAAGNGTAALAGDTGPATSASLNVPEGITVDSAGNIYVADSANNRVRRISAGGTITTLVAGLFDPLGVAVDGSGNVYIADTGNMCIKKVDSAGTITTVAGNGKSGSSGDGGAAIAAELAGPTAVTVDGSGNLYISDTGNNKIRKVVLSSGIITTFAGNGTASFAGDGGLATLAGLDSPGYMAIDGAGNLYFTDSQNHRVRKINPAGTINTVAGFGSPGFTGDGGDATQAMLYSPTGLALDNAGSLFIVDSGNQRVRKVSF